MSAPPRRRHKLPIHIHHFTERLGAIVMIAMGEAAVRLVGMRAESALHITCAAMVFAVVFNLHIGCEQNASPPRPCPPPRCAR